MRDLTTEEEALILDSALFIGEDQISSRVTSLPITIPRCVPLSFKRRSGHGEAARSPLILSWKDGGEVVRTTDLSLLIPSPEIEEKREIQDKAG